jgi:hypothetical protein
MKQKILFPAPVAVFAFTSVLPLEHAATYANGTATATFNVTLALQANCAISATPLNFGTNGVLATALNQQTTVAITCTNTTPYKVGLDGGTAAGSTIPSRLTAGTATGSTVQPWVSNSIRMPDGRPYGVTLKVPIQWPARVPGRCSRYPAMVRCLHKPHRNRTHRRRFVRFVSHKCIECSVDGI